MKNLKFSAAALIILIFPAFLQARTSYFGFSGLNFVPTADILITREFSMAYSSKATGLKEGNMDIIDLIPYSFRLNFGLAKNRWEFSFGNCYYFYYIPKGEKEPKLFNKSVPMPSAIKYLLMEPVKETGYASVAIGMAFPFGAYAVLSESIDYLEWVRLRFHTSFSSTFAYSWGIFGGLELNFSPKVGPFISRFAFTLEGGRWGVTDKFPETEFLGIPYDEVFWSVGLTYRWLSSLNIDIIYREEDITGYGGGPIRSALVGLSYSGRFVIESDKHPEEKIKERSKRTRIDSHLRKAKELRFKQKKYEEAIDEFNKVLEIDPANPEAINGRRETWIMLEEMESKDKLEKTKEEKIIDYRSIFNNGVKLHNNKEYESAIVEWKKIPSSCEYYQKAQKNIKIAEKGLLKKVGSEGTE